MMAFLNSNSQENEELRFLSFNCKNFNDDICKLDFLQQCVQNHDVVFLQEHWLYKSELYKLSKLGKNVNVIGTSGMEEHVCRLGRPYGGCAIIWKSDLKCKTSQIMCKSNRVCGLVIDMLNGVKIVLLNVYMPCDTGCYDRNYDLYREVINELQQIRTQYQHAHFVCGGDFNASLCRDSPNSRALKYFVQQCGLHTYNEIDGADVPYTYFCSQFNTTSVIDYFFVSASLVDCVRSYAVIKNHLHSDHIPISMVLYVNSNRLITQEREFNSRIAWHKATDADLELYRELLDMELDKIQIDTDVLRCSNVYCKQHKQCIIQLYNDVVDAMREASGVLPRTGSSSKDVVRKTVPGWKEHVEPRRVESLYWHECWLQAGKPQIGEIADNMRIARANYHKAVKQVQKNKDNIVMNRIANSMLNNNTRNMWSELKKIKGRNASVASCIDGVSDNCEISNLFKKKYETVFNGVPTSKLELDKVYSNIIKGISSHGNDIEINVSDVKLVISKLKSGKQGGEEEKLSSNHFIHASTKLSVILSVLYKLMLVHGVSPPGMSAGTMVPIPKNKNASVSDGNNYRSITLGSVICKIFDLIVLTKERQKLDTSELQFGYKEHSSTVQCSFTLLETISYYNTRGSDVNILLLDATKAFDKVHYGKLFSLLIERRVSPIVLRLLFQMYTQQKIHVKWSDALSDEFPVSNGVKQGGILSPVLFAVYMDVLINRLRSSGLGCHVGNKWIGCLAYADDVALLCPSKAGLQKMLDISMSFAYEYNMTFNGSKSQFLVFSNKVCLENSVYLKVNNDYLFNVNKAKYLGNIIDVSDKDSMLKAAEAKFWKSFNIFMADFGKLHTNVKQKLFNTYCCDYYGSVLWQHDSKYFSRLCVAWRKAVRVIANLPYRTHCYLLPFIVGNAPLDVTLEVRFLRFAKSIANGKCSSVVKHVYDQCQNCPFSVTGKKIREFCYKHEIVNLLEFNFSENKWLSQNYNNVAHTVVELIQIRDGILDCDLEYNEVKEILDVLCTS